MPNNIESAPRTSGNNESSLKSEAKSLQEETFKIIFGEYPESFFKVDPVDPDSQKGSVNSDYQALKKVIESLSKESFDEIITYTMKYYLDENNKSSDENNKSSFDYLFDILSNQPDIIEEKGIKGYIEKNPVEAISLILRKAYLLERLEQERAAAAKGIQIIRPYAEEQLTIQEQLRIRERSISEELIRAASISHLLNALLRNVKKGSQQEAIVENLITNYKKQIEDCPFGLGSIRSFDK